MPCVPASENSEFRKSQTHPCDVGIGLIDPNKLATLNDLHQVYQPGDPYMDSSYRQVLMNPL